MYTLRQANVSDNVNKSSLSTGKVISISPINAISCSFDC